MVKKCESCGYADNDDDAGFCEICGKQIGKIVRKKATTKSSGGQDLPQSWLILLIIMEIVGGVFIFLLGFWALGLPIIIAAGYFAYTQGRGTLVGDLIPRVTILIAAASINMITIIPGYETISLFGFVIGWIMIILTLPERTKEGAEKAGKKAFGGPVLLWGLIGIASTLLWTWIVLIGANFQTILTYEAITIGMVAASIVWKQPIDSKWKLLGTLICFSPLIFFGITFLFVTVGAFFGNIFDQVQDALSGGGTGVSGTALDMILNPQLAIQAGLKPATTREIKETEGPASVEFTVSGESLPESGCYDSSTFQIIGRVKNVGGEFINDLRMRMAPKEAISLLGIEGLERDTVCQDIELSKCQKVWDISSIPTGVTVSKNCLVESVPTPEEQIDGVAPSHACFISITAETGFHSLTRLPVEFIESNYGRNKFEQKQLTQKIVPGTTSIGAVELSLGGFEQPILYYKDSDSKVTMITSISESGNGEALTYESAYLYIPTSLLDDGQCSSTTDDWDCLSVSDGVIDYQGDCKDTDGDCDEDDDNGSIELIDCDILDDAQAKKYCEGFNNFKKDGEIGDFTQFSYDNSDRLLANDYAICFYKNNIIDSSIISTGTCTLKIGKVMTDELRKTLIIRGDVLYTYSVRGQATINVKDCDV